MSSIKKFNANIEIQRLSQYQDIITKLLYNQHHDCTDNINNKILTKSVSFQVTDDCNLKCSYCYQINKGKRRLDLNTAKKFIDGLLDGKYNNYINPKTSPGLILDFIGGEPFLEIELIDSIVDYFIGEAIKRRHQWACYYRITICSNGVLYRDPRVQKFLDKYKNNISFSVTLDGNKELHDSCRVFHNGKGSYNIALDACEDWIKRGNYMGSKITIAKENLDHLFSAIIHMIELGYNDINANCVYEADWNNQDALKFYNQMIKIADYILDHNLYNKLYMALFESNFFRPKLETDLDNWCGGTGSMLAIDPDGNLFPCIRYMESSLGSSRERYSIGNVDDGIGNTKCHCDRMDCLNNINRRTESTDECFYCPIAEGCSWCSAWNYQLNGTPDSRATSICIMHKARALANSYYWNKMFLKYNFDKFFKLNIPDEWSLEVLPLDELLYLKELECKAKNRDGVTGHINNIINEKVG